MKKICSIFVAFIILLCGCSNSLDIEYPDNPIKFETYTYVNPDNADDTYRAFKYNEREYIPYATLENSVAQNDISTCLGCIVQDGKETDTWVVTLSDSDNNDYLMLYYPNTHNQQPEFYRAIDTKGKEISTPDYISDEKFEFWR